MTATIVRTATRRPLFADGSAALPAALTGQHGALPFRRVGYQALGCAGRPATAVLGGISAGAHLAAHPACPQPGWWDAQVGAGRALDPARRRLVGIDYLGATLAPGDAVPLVGTHDQARALAAALDALGIHRLHSLVGASYGGMVALAFAELFPERVERLAVISAAHQAHPMATALRALQRRLVRDALARGQGAEGLALARALAMTTYRGEREFAARFACDWRVEDGVARFPVEEYLEHQGRRYPQRFAAERFLCLSQSIDLHRVDPARVTVPTALLAVRGDAIAPLWQMEELAARLGGPATLHRIDSPFAHDAFLKEAGAVASFLTHALESAP